MTDFVSKKSFFVEGKVFVTETEVKFYGFSIFNGKLKLVDVVKENFLWFFFLFLIRIRITIA